MQANILASIAPKLSKLVISPSRVASILDWKKVGGTIMSLDVQKNAIGLAISKHPSEGFREKERPNKDFIRILSPIEIPKSSKTKKIEIRQRVDQISKNFGVCAFVVNWPLQPNGHAGAPCGITLHVLEALCNGDEGKNPIIRNNRPFTLWEDSRLGIIKEEDQEDEWGRNAAFGQVPSDCTPGMVYRSYHSWNHPSSHSSSNAAKILKDFIAQHYDLSEYNSGYSSIGFYDRKKESTNAGLLERNVEKHALNFFDDKRIIRRCDSTIQMDGSQQCSFDDESQRNVFCSL